MTANQATQPERFYFQDLPNEKLSDKELIAILFNLTGQVYTFATASDMRWGANGEVLDNGKPGYEKGFYQLMPASLDDGFFDWYCLKREEYQFFKTREGCTLHFINYWFQWKRQNSVEKSAATPMTVKDLKELLAGANEDLPVSVFNGMTSKAAVLEGSGVAPYNDPEEAADFTIVY